LSDPGKLAPTRAARKGGKGNQKREVGIKNVRAGVTGWGGTLERKILGHLLEVPGEENQKGLGEIGEMNRWDDVKTLKIWALFDNLRRGVSLRTSNPKDKIRPLY